MDPNKGKTEDVNFTIGGESFEPSPNFRKDRGAHKLAADALIGMLPHKYKQAIASITREQGMNRRSRRATRTLVRLGIQQVNRDNTRLLERKHARDEHGFALFLRIEKRVARGIDRPLPGMTQERYDEIKRSYGRMESLSIDGQTIATVSETLVRVDDKGKSIAIREVR